ncbi:hypothetical protein D3C87_1793670 [compost metagenome]
MTTKAVSASATSTAKYHVTQRFASKLLILTVMKFDSAPKDSLPVSFNTKSTTLTASSLSTISAIIPKHFIPSMRKASFSH